MTGIYSSPVYIKEFENVEHVVKNDKDYSRILWIPSRQPLAYSSISHPTIEASRLVQLRPFQSSIIGGYELFNFLRDSEVTKELLDISSIGYVAYPFPDARRLNLKKDNIEYYNTFNSQMKDASWFGEELSNPPVSLLKTKNSQDKMFLTQKSFYVIGSDQLYFDLNKLNLLDLSKNAFFFGELAPKSIADANNIQTVLYKKELIDLAMTGVDGDNFVFPASFLENNPNGNGWWKRDSYRYIDVRAFLQEKYSLDTLDFDYGGGWSFSEGNLENTFTSPKFKKGKMLYARVMTSTRSGKIEFYQGDSLIGLISTGIDEPERLQLTLKGWDSIPDKIIDLENGNFRWFEIGKLESDNFLTIKTYGDINIVNSLVVEDETHVEEIISSFTNTNIIVWDELTETEKMALFDHSYPSQLSFSSISPTKYKVYVQGIDSPTTLVFTQMYDDGWKLSNTSSRRAYGMLNSFRIDSDGEYTLIYTPQKYVDLGFTISVISIVLAIASLIYLEKGNLENKHD